MKVIYKKCITEKIQEAKLDAKLVHKEIEHIELNEAEWWEFESYLMEYVYTWFIRSNRDEWNFDGIKITKGKV